MSRLLEEHDACELREQWVAEHYWPSGNAAESWRAELIGKLIAQRIDHRQETQAEICMIRKMLVGTFDPEKDLPKKRRLPGPEEMKMLW